MKTILFLVATASTIFALTTDQIKQNCCTLYDAYPDGTVITVGSVVDVYNQEYKLQMTDTQALTISGYCDTETHTIYSWENPQQLDGLPEWANPQYTKVAYSYNCSTCDKVESDFPTTKDGFSFQSTEISTASCLAKIQVYAKDGNGTAYSISDKCPTLIGCYYNLPDSNSENPDNPDDNTGTDNNTNNDTNTIPDSISVNNLSTIENKLGNIESSSLNTATAIEDLNSKFEVETDTDFAAKITEAANSAKESLDVVKSSYEAITQSFEGLKDYVTSNPLTYKNLEISSSCDYDFKVFDKSIKVNMCKYNYLFAPVIVFFLNIFFMYSLIRLNIYFFRLIFISNHT